MIRRLTAREWASDAAFAVIVVCVLSLFDLGVWGTMSFERPLEVIEAVVLTGCLTIRRWAPVLALFVALVLGIVHVEFALVEVPTIWLAVLFLLFAVGRHGSARERILGGVIALTGVAIATYYLAIPRIMMVGVDGTIDSIVVADAPLDDGWIVVQIGVPLAMLLAIAFIAGILRHSLSQTRASQRERDAEHIRAEQAAELAVIEEERSRIARDMHDVIAHSLAVMIAQANGARYAKEVELKDESLRTIARVGQDALGDVRSLLARLRHAQAPDPEASLRELPDLVERMRGSGLDVQLEVVGDPQPLARTQDIALYRIAQESLTNALRHGGGSASVRLEWLHERVVMTVANPTAGPLAPAGHGLVGMRERAQLADGTLSAGPDGASFIVVAGLPIQATGSVQHRGTTVT